MAVRFAGTTDQLSYSGALPGSTDGATVVCWVYLSVDRNDWSTFTRSSQGGTSIQYLALDGTGTDSGWFSAGGSIAGISFTVGAWHRVAATLSGTTGTLYTAPADGPVAVGTNTSMTSGEPTELGIGGRGAGDASEPFDGRIAGWKAWAGALTRAEIEREWSQLWPVRTAGLVSAWPLLHSGVDGRLDASGNGRTLAAGATAAGTEDDPPVPWHARPRRLILRGGAPVPTTATLSFTVSGRVRLAWIPGFAAPRWTVDRGVSATWRMETVVMITRSVLSHEAILFGPIRYLVDGVSTSPTGLTVEAALTDSEAGDNPSSWSAAAWSTIVEAGRNTYWAKVAIGPGSSIGAQTVGVRKGWVRITASGETPVLPAGYVEFI